MHIILGGTGHVGSAAAKALLARGEPVTIVAREEAKAEDLKRAGAKVAVADVLDTDALHRVLATGTRAFLLNPPADPKTDTDAQEKRTIAAILTALDGAGLDKIVAHSTYGAQAGDRLGDLNTLYALEQGVKAQAIPAAIIRAAYYFSNWDAALETARADGVVHTMYPVDFELPMVAPQDLGEQAARLLTDDRTGTYYVEGPARYSSADVAAAFAAALGTPVKAIATPRDQWVEGYKALGFSDRAAESYARMTGITLDGDYEQPDLPIRGKVTLHDYIRRLVDESPGG
ncbi:NAD(P)H-binding protein [Sphingomonas sp. So64.6b]|uniref:NAD(P)H-binding protein n=1 Tax=Sphingomonas sp. So64.6b TaxID=2997354 RepID=UPI00160024F0|nr:NAD(P)H-binding protein [Sphingomonas sp. So64.6b]QNA85938.1 NAD(P)H-binding protein [Sphingomonas sp. So64.6b]